MFNRVLNLKKWSKTLNNSSAIANELYLQTYHVDSTSFQRGIHVVCLQGLSVFDHLVGLALNELNMTLDELHYFLYSSKLSYRVLFNNYPKQCFTH